MNRIFFIPFLVLGTLFTGCRKNIDNLTVTETGAIPYEGVQSSLYGRILNPDGTPVIGANVTVDESAPVISNDQGLFFFYNHRLNKNGAKVTVSKDGYFETVRYAFPRLGGHATMEIKMIPKILTTTFSGINGATFSIGTGGEVTIPANGVAELSSGAGYTGSVNVYAVYLDPSNGETFKLMPGDLRAVDSTGYAKVLKSFGMIGVEMETASGQKLRMSDGVKAKISLKIPGSFLGKAPATIPLWHFDKFTGYWQEQGSASLVNDSYEGEVAHFSFWNCDIPADYVIVRGRITTTNNEPIANTPVEVYSSTLFGCAYGSSDGEGYFGGLMPQNELLFLKIINKCDQSAIYNSTIGPFAEATEMPAIEISGLNTTTVFGRLTDCTNGALSSGVIVIESTDTQRVPYLIQNCAEDGTFNFALNNCDNININLKVTAYQPESLLQSTTIEVPLNSNNLDLGTIPVCTQLDEYIVINGDGKSHTCYQSLSFYEDNGDVYINGSGNQSSADTSNIMIHVRNYDPVTKEADVSNYKLITSNLNVIKIYECNYCADTCNCSPSQTERIKFSSFPISQGQYAIGTLSGNVKNKSDQYVPFNLTFRIRKN